MRPFLGAIATFLQGEVFDRTLQALLSLQASMQCAALRVPDKRPELPATTLQAMTARVFQLRPCAPRCSAQA